MGVILVQPAVIPEKKSPVQQQWRLHCMQWFHSQSHTNTSPILQNCWWSNWTFDAKHFDLVQAENQRPFMLNEYTQQNEYTAKNVLCKDTPSWHTPTDPHMLWCSGEKETAFHFLVKRNAHMKVRYSTLGAYLTEAESLCHIKWNALLRFTRSTEVFLDFACNGAAHWAHIHSASALGDCKSSQPAGRDIIYHIISYHY